MKAFKGYKILLKIVTSIEQQDFPTSSDILENIFSQTWNISLWAAVVLRKKYCVVLFFLKILAYVLII